MNYYNKLPIYIKYIFAIIVVFAIFISIYLVRNYNNKNNSNKIIENFGFDKPVNPDSVSDILQQIQYGTINYEHDETFIHSSSRSLTNGVGIYMFDKSDGITISPKHELRIYPMKYQGEMCFRFDVILKDNEGNFYVKKHENRSGTRHWGNMTLYKSSALDKEHGWHTYKNENDLGVYSSIVFDNATTVYGVIIAPRGEASRHNQYIKTFVVGYTKDTTDSKKRDKDMILVNKLKRTPNTNIKILKGNHYVESGHPVPNYELKFKIVNSDSMTLN